jgi:D-alanyl-D-alanine carboxypeptidase
VHPANRPLLFGTKQIVAALALAAFLTAGFISSEAVAATKHRTTAHHQGHSAKKATAHKRTSTHHASAYNPRYASIVMDADSGVILSQSNADASVYPASLTKMMTLLLTFERLENGTLSLNHRVAISNHAASQAPSKLDLPPGSSIELKNAIYAVVTKSANDIAVAIGEDIGGSEGHFVYLMNEKARALGMTHTQFMNACGLHNPAQVTTARDFARLSRYIIKTYPHEYRYFSTRNFNYNGVSNRNHNRLMETYAGMDGIKTGYVLPSGFNLAASAVRNNHRLIAIVFGGKTAVSRNNDVAGLLDAGFEKLETMKNQPVLVSQNTITPDPRLAQTNGIAATKVPASTLLHPSGQTVPARQVAASADSVLVPQTGAIGEMVGQGDADPAVTRRFETGMMAIAAIKGTLKPGQTSAATTPAANPAGTPTPQILGNDDWAIQLGSYPSRVKSDEALNAAISRLPADIRSTASPVIVPLQSGDGYVYRARLRGFSRDQASAACKYFNNCLTISPRAF